ncbi:hypothetical protein GIB67_014751, partial [Kingdonia uniflora]
KAAVTAFTNALWLDCKAKEYLFLNKPTTVEEMIAKVNGYIDMERIMSERKKSTKFVLSTKFPPPELTNEPKEEQGDQKRIKGNTGYPQRSGPQNKPIFPKMNVRIPTIFQLLLKDTLYRVSQPLEPIENRPLCLHHKVNHHYINNCYALQRILELIFKEGQMLEYIVDPKSYQDGNYKKQLKVVPVNDRAEEKHLYYIHLRNMIEINQITNSNRS